MNKIGFTKYKSDAAVFYKHNRKGFAIIAIAVDNLMITAINDNIIHKIKYHLRKPSLFLSLSDLPWLHF